MQVNSIDKKKQKAKLMEVFHSGNINCVGILSIIILPVFFIRSKMGESSESAILPTNIYVNLPVYRIMD